MLNKGMVKDDDLETREMIEWVLSRIHIIRPSSTSGGGESMRVAKDKPCNCVANL